MRYNDYNLARINRCPVDIYIASDKPYPYPYKLIKPEHANQRVADSCSTLIMDSGIGDDTTNQDVIDLAIKYDADFVVPCDELHNQDVTTQAVRAFMDIYERSECRAIPIIPLQPPYDEHYHDLSEFYYYALGGIAFDYSPSEQLEEIQRFRHAAGPQPYAHALGVGGSMTIVRTLANNPNLVQSVDCSTPEQAAIRGQIIDTQLKQREINILHGEGSNANRIDLMQTNAYQLVDAYTRAKRQQTSLDPYL